MTLHTCVLLVATIFGAYIVGAFPTGYLFAKFFFDIDIREHGSGNIGASNIARVLGKHYFALIFFIDAAKAALFLKVVAHSPLQEYGHLLMYLVAAGLLLGNAWSVFLRGSGGKGVATLIGIISIFFGALFTVFFAVLWVFVLALTSQPYCASLIASLVCALLALSQSLPHAHFMVASFVWLIFTHRSNILKHAISVFQRYL